MPIKPGWRDASLVLWDFGRSNKHCIHVSTTCDIILFSYFFTGLKLNENLKNDHTFSNKLQLIILRTYVHYLFQPEMKSKDGGS